MNAAVLFALAGVIVFVIGLLAGLPPTMALAWFEQSGQLEDIDADHLKAACRFRNAGFALMAAGIALVLIGRFM